MKIVASNSLAKNSIYNLAGSVTPLMVAVFTIPLLVSGLGEEKFGILSLAWIVIGYFSLFDFGIGRALTKIVAENLGNNRSDEIPSLMWTSLFLMMLISLCGSILIFIFTPYLVVNVFSISAIYQEESILAFYTLALSIPIVTTTAGLRGVLEAYQKFGAVNSIKTVLGIFTFLVPLICLLFTQSLFIIVLGLTIIRLLIWIFYYRECRRIEIIKRSEIKVRRNFIKPVFRMSAWMSVSNLIGPIILYIDRFLIGAMISTVAVTYYTTPYEVVTKLLIIPSALTGVLFPTISSNYNLNPDFTFKLLIRSIKYVFILIFPIILVISVFAREGIYIWLGADFATNSTLVSQLFAIGILLNSLAYFPFTFLQSIGKPDITAKIHFFELPVYLLLMIYLIPKYGIIGVGFAWLTRIFIDTSLLFYFTQRIFPDKYLKENKYLLIIVFFSIVITLITVLISSISVKLILTGTVLSIFSFVVWKKILTEEDLTFILSKFR